MIDLYTLQAISRNNPNNTPTPEDFLSNRAGTYGQWLDFTDKGGYLAWRAEWRRVYAELSADIRAARKEWRAEGSYHADFQLSHRLWTRRALARTMLSLRQASKMRAEQQWQAQRAAEQVA